MNIKTINVQDFSQLF